MSIKVIYKKEDWKYVAECIRSDQVKAEDVVAIFNDNPGFEKWYRKEYLNKEGNN